jgi:hypothetical protein
MSLYQIRGLSLLSLSLAPECEGRGEELLSSLWSSLPALLCVPNNEEKKERPLRDAWSLSSSPLSLSFVLDGEEAREESLSVPSSEEKKDNPLPDPSSPWSSVFVSSDLKVLGGMV